MHDNLPPYEFTNDQGQPTGFAYDLMQALARDTGLNITVISEDEFGSGTNPGPGKVLIRPVFTRGSPTEAPYISEPIRAVQYRLYTRDDPGSHNEILPGRGGPGPGRDPGRLLRGLPHRARPRRDSPLFAAGVDFHGLHDFTARMGRAYEEGRFERPPDLDRARETAWRSSPAAHVGTWRSPVLLVHGDDDRNVEFAQTVDLVARLAALGVPFEELVVPDDSHHFLRFANQSARLHGIDLSGRMALGKNAWGDWGLAAVASLARGSNLDTGDNLYNIMPANATFTLTHKLGGWSNGIELVDLPATRGAHIITQPMILKISKQKWAEIMWMRMG